MKTRRSCKRAIEASSSKKPRKSSSSFTEPKMEDIELDDDVQIIGEKQAVELNEEVDTETENDNNKEKEDEFLSARRCLPNDRNPFFMVQRQRQGAEKRLHVPAAIIRYFNLEFPSEILFIGLDGRKWPGSVKTWRDGRVWIKGWDSFCKWNYIAYTDKCICEILLGKNAIRVHTVSGEPQ